MPSNCSIKRALYSLIGAVVFGLGPANVVSDAAERPATRDLRRLRERLQKKAATGRYTSTVERQTTSVAATTLDEEESPSDPNFDARGFSDRRDAGSLLPFEHVDPFTGNLLLTFTDLRLPGNAGFDLVVQRTYNSKIFSDYNAFFLTEDSWAGVGWSLHMGRVIEPGPNGRAIVEMPDGSSHPVYIRDNDPQKTITRGLWLYDSDASPPALYLTNGVVYRFGHIGNTMHDGRGTRYATSITDPYGNRIDISYWAATSSTAPRDAIRTITQRLGNARTRTVDFHYDTSARKALSRMTYFDGSRTRTWQYGQSSLDRHTTFPESLLDWVQPPEGPAWYFGYNVTSAPYYELTGLTTPNGGSVRYAYDWSWYSYCRVALLPETYPVPFRGVASRETGGTDIPSGEWTFAYAQGTQANQTVVTTPCNTTRYTFYGIGGDSGQWCPYENGQRTMWPYKVGAQLAKEVRAGSTLLQSETFRWKMSAFIGWGPQMVGHYPMNPVVNPLLEARTVNRPRANGAAQHYVTTHYYHSASYNDYGRPYLSEESGDGTRTTERTFDYGFTPYIRDRVSSETVTVSGESPAYTWTAAYRDTDGFKTSESRYGVVKSFGPDADGNVATVTDGEGNTTRFTYDWGVLEDTTTPRYVIDRTINPDGTVREESRRGFTTSFVYDDLFRRTWVVPPIGNATRTEFDPNGRWMRVTRGASQVRQDLDGFGRVSGSVNSQGVATDVAYDSCGRVGFQSYPYTGNNVSGTSFTRDGLGRVTQLSHPDGSWTRYWHDGLDVTVEELLRVGQTRTTFQDWSAFGDPDDRRLSGVRDAAGGQWGYAYNALGRLRLVDPPVGGNRVFQYNARDQLEWEQHPESGATFYTYDGAGRMWTRRDAKNQTFVFTYDGNGRLTYIDGPGAADTAFGWDASDHRILTDNGRVRSDFIFDGNNRLHQRMDAFEGQAFVTTYDYDANDNLRTIQYPSGQSISYGVNSEGQVWDVRKTGASTALATSFLYHPSGGVRSFALGNGKTQTFSYDGRHRIDLLQNGALNLDYDHDFVGNVETIADTRSGMSQSFDYDRLDRLTWAGGWWGSGSIAYTAAGDRQNSSLGGWSEYTYASGRLATVTGDRPDAYQYDSNGNMTTSGGGTNSYAYSPENYLESATLAGTTSTYRYDADGLRKRKTAGGETRYYVHGLGGQLLAEYVTGCGGGTRLVKDYVYAGTRLIAAIGPVVPTVSLEATSSTVGEAAGSVPVRVRLTTPAGTASQWPVCVNYSTVDGTATLGTDYGGTSGLLILPAGTASGATAAINVPILNDPDMNVTEHFTLRLTSVQGAHLAAAAVHTVTIEDDDAPFITFASASSTSAEASGTAALAVTVTSRDGQPLTAPASVTFATQDGTAVAVEDYAATSGVLTFPAGSPSGGTQSVVVTLPNDGLNEDLESFSVRLSNPAGAALGQFAAHLVTLSDDDPLPSMAVQHVTVAEPATTNGVASFTVSLSAPSGREVRVNYATADVTAAAGSDYLNAGGTLSFAKGVVSRTIAVPILPDVLEEPNEAFLVRLTGPVSALIADDEAQGVIVDGDGGASACVPVATLPFTISSPGQYCLARPLATSMASGTAISVEANQVILDLAGYALSGRAAGPGTFAYGIRAVNRASVTVRNGIVEGFFIGIALDDTTADASDSKGHVVEGVRAVENTFMGLDVRGRGNVVRDNQVIGTGGTTALGPSAESYGIRTIGSSARLIGNDVSGTRAVGDRRPHAIAVWDGVGTVVESNRVAGDGSPQAVGVWLLRSQSAIAVGNEITRTNHGLLFEQSSGDYRDNVCLGVATPYSGGTDAGNNH